MPLQINDTARWLRRSDDEALAARYHALWWPLQAHLAGLRRWRQLLWEAAGEEEREGTREEADLAEADRHIAQSEARIGKQLDLIARLRKNGGEVAEAEAQLATLVQSLAALHVDRQLTTSRNSRSPASRHAAQSQGAGFRVFTEPLQKDRKKAEARAGATAVALSRRGGASQP